MGESQTANKENTEKTRMIFKKYKIEIKKEIDGSAPENKELRDKLFDLSGQPATYPQLFSVTSEEDGDYKLLAFGGQVPAWEELQDIIKEQVKEDPNWVQNMKDEGNDIDSIPEVFKDFIK